MKPSRRYVAGALLAALAAAGAQETPVGYTPLFSEAQIQNASEPTRQRMIDTERTHREKWMARNTPVARGGEGGEGDTSYAPAPASAPAPAQSPSKIYRWVDKDGRVNFGDRPAGGAKEVTLPDRTQPAAAGSTALGRSGDD